MIAIIFPLWSFIFQPFFEMTHYCIEHKNRWCFSACVFKSVRRAFVWIYITKKTECSVKNSGCDHTPWVSSAQCVARLHIEWKLKKKQTEFISVRVFLLCSVSTRCKCCKVCDTKATRSADKRLLLSSMLCFNGRVAWHWATAPLKHTEASVVLEVALPARYVFFFFDSWTCTWPSSRGMITRLVCLTDWFTAKMHHEREDT